MPVACWTSMYGLYAPKRLLMLVFHGSTMVPTYWYQVGFVNADGMLAQTNARSM